MRIPRSAHFFRAIWVKSQIILNACMFFKISETELTVISACLYMPKEFSSNDIYNFLNRCETDETFRQKQRITNILKDISKLGYIIFIGQKSDGFTYVINKDNIKYFVDAYNSIVSREQRWLTHKEYRPPHTWRSKGYIDVKNWYKRMKYAKNKKNAVV